MICKRCPIVDTNAQKSGRRLGGGIHGYEHEAIPYVACHFLQPGTVGDDFGQIGFLIGYGLQIAIDPERPSVKSAGEDVADRAEIACADLISAMRAALVEGLDTSSEENTSKLQ